MIGLVQAKWSKFEHMLNMIANKRDAELLHLGERQATTALSPRNSAEIYHYGNY